MPKAKKEDVKSPKLYHGTTQLKAKEACSVGLVPYELKDFDAYGVPRNLYASSREGITLTSSYPGLLSYETSSHKEKWGIMEIDVSHLSPEGFAPYEGFLLEKMKVKIVDEDDRYKKLSQIRQSISSHCRQWRESLEEFGFCAYKELIRPEAISKVTIYDPQSNPIITRAIVSCIIGSKLHRSNLNRQRMLTRWLIGENVTAEEWLGTSVYSKMSHTEKDQVSQVLHNKNGLDIYHYDVSGGKKVSWW